MFILHICHTIENVNMGMVLCTAALDMFVLAGVTLRQHWKLQYEHGLCYGNIGNVLISKSYIRATFEIAI